MVKGKEPGILTIPLSVPKAQSRAEDAEDWIWGDRPTIMITLIYAVEGDECFLKPKDRNKTRLPVEQNSGLGTPRLSPFLTSAVVLKDFSLSLHSLHRFSVHMEEYVLCYTFSSKLTHYLALNHNSKFLGEKIWWTQLMLCPGTLVQME